MLNWSIKISWKMRKKLKIDQNGSKLNQLESDSNWFQTRKINFESDSRIHWLNNHTYLWTAQQNIGSLNTRIPRQNVSSWLIYLELQSIKSLKHRVIWFQKFPSTLKIFPNQQVSKFSMFMKREEKKCSSWWSVINFLRRILKTGHKWSKQSNVTVLIVFFSLSSENHIFHLFPEF